MTIALLLLILFILWLNTMQREHKYIVFKFEYDKICSMYHFWLCDIDLYDDEHKITLEFPINPPYNVLYGLKPINMKNMVSVEILEKLSYTGLSLDEYNKKICIKKRQQKLERLCK